MVTADSHLADDASTPTVPITSIGGLEEAEGWYDGEGEMLYGECEAGDDGGDDIVHNNGRRAGAAAHALVAFARRTRMLSDSNDEDVETVIGDLLGDLRHLADSLGLDYEALDARGQMHYDDEILGE